MLRQFGSGLRTHGLVVRSMGVALSAVTLLSGTAMAQTTGTTPPTGPDVVVPTEGENTPGGTTRIPVAGTRFACQINNGQYTVMYFPESQPNQAYPWAVPSQMGGGWSPERRCNEISRRLESYRPDGLLEMRTGIENGYNTICVTTERVGGCRIVLTVPQGQDPVALRDRIFQNLTVADSGQQTQGVLTFRNNDRGLLNQIGQVLNLPGVGRTTNTRTVRSSNINLRPFLDRADGGTGERLTGGMAIRSTTNNRPATNRSNLRLNPNIFR